VGEKSVKAKKRTGNIEGRIAFLQMVLNDPDAGRFYSVKRLNQFERELKTLQKGTRND
jgi:hypothetical protein